MAELNVGTVYGHALFQVASEMDRKETILEEAEAILKIMKEEEKFSQLLESPAISVVSKKSVIKSVFEGHISQEMINFCYIMIDKRRFQHFSKAIKAYKEYYDRQEGFAYGEIYSVKELSPEKIEAFERETSKLLQKNIKLKNQLDKKLIGGVKILIDGKILDASIRKRLEDIAVDIM